MSATESYPRLLHTLNDLRANWRKQKLCEGLLLALAGTSAMLLLMVAADNLLHLEKPGRLVLAGLLWGSLLAALIGLVGRRWLEDHRDDFFAALVEQKHPELHNQLINALQLGRGHANGCSPRLIEAIVNDAANATADLDMNSSVNRQPLKRAAVIALGVASLIAVYAVVLTPRFTNGLARVLLPLADLPPYTATQLVAKSIQPGNATVPEGKPIVFRVEVAGIVPAAAQLVRVAPGSHSQAAVMPPEKTSENAFSSLPIQANESFDYYIVAGDARSASYHVEVVKRPQVQRISVTYTLPAYTAKEPRRVEESDGEITAIPGTRVEVFLTATKLLQEALLVVDGREPLSLQKGAVDHTWLTSFVLWNKTDPANEQVGGPLIQAPTRYQIRLKDTDGYENADPLWHSITPARDELPTVMIITPGRDLQCKPDAQLELRVDARDDYGIREVRLLYRVNEEQKVHELARFPHPGEPKLETSDRFAWELRSRGLKGGDVVQYWAEATDRNNLIARKPSESRRFSLFLATREQAAAKLDLQIGAYAQTLEELVTLQRLNRVQTTAGMTFDTLADRETTIRTRTRRLARAMEKDALPVTTIVQSLDSLASGLMAEVVKLFESGRDTTDSTRASEFRAQSVPVQDKIIKELENLLARLQRNEQAKTALRKLEKKDKPVHKQITDALTQTVNDLDKLLQDQTELASKFERMPKKPVEEAKEEALKGMKELEKFQKKWEQWHKSKIEELAKLPAGFVDDFGLRPDLNKIFEEIEKTATRPKAEKAEVALEDLGAGMATKMKEDLETWLPDTPDATKWVLEEPLDKKPMKIPEMPLPKGVEDLVGDLLQKEEEFDQEADDVTSAWGDNLDQAGWGTGDGPISLFSAKGKTGNDLPNNMELTGRSGEGRRGKSSGQNVSETAKGLPGRKPAARVTNERYEPGQLKQEGQLDPGGATGGGKKSDAGRKGLQGGTPPDFVRDMGRLSEKQAGIREKAEQVALKLDSAGISSRRLTEGIELMKQSEQDLRDLRYQDAARKRRQALNHLRSTLNGVDQTTAAQLERVRDLPPRLRTELLQAADEGYPPGYEKLLKKYFKALSIAE
jgi:hypothetical protein